MNPISGIAPQRIAAPETVRQASPAGPAAQEDRPDERRDEYIPAGEEEPVGLYRVEQDGEGKRRISFDAPGPRPEEEEGPEKETARCTTDTGQVDREIEALREKEQQLEQRLRDETDERKRDDLERQLAQTKQELRQKDNDTYRRSHAVIS